MTLSSIESSYASGLSGLSSFPWHVDRSALFSIQLQLTFAPSLG